MTFDAQAAYLNPTFDRSEWRLYMGHASLGEGKTGYPVAPGIETMPYNIAVESSEKATIDQKNPIVRNSAGGMTMPAEFELSAGNPLYDAFFDTGAMGLVDQEFEGLLVYHNKGVKIGGIERADAVFAQRTKMKITVSALGGAGTEKSKVTFEAKTSGDIDNGYVEIGETSTFFDKTLDQWKFAGFTKVPTMTIGSTFTIAQAGA